MANKFFGYYLEFCDLILKLISSKIVIDFFDKSVKLEQVSVHIMFYNLSEVNRNF